MLKNKYSDFCFIRVIDITLYKYNSHKIIDRYLWVLTTYMFNVLQDRRDGHHILKRNT